MGSSPPSVTTHPAAHTSAADIQVPTILVTTTPWFDVHEPDQSSLSVRVGRPYREPWRRDARRAVACRSMPRNGGRGTGRARSREVTLSSRLRGVAGVRRHQLDGPDDRVVERLELLGRDPDLLVHRGAH